MKKMILMILFTTILIEGSDHDQKLQKSNARVPQFPRLNSTPQLFDIDKTEIIQAQLIKKTSREKFIIYNGEKYVCVANPTSDQSINTSIHKTTIRTCKQKKLNATKSSSSDKYEYWFPTKNKTRTRLKLARSSSSDDACIQQ